MEEQGLTEADPTTLKEAQDVHDWRDWEKAPGRQAIGNKWVFVRKRDEHGNVVKHKARLVIQGFSQKPGVDYSEQGTFAPVMRFDTLRILNGKLKEEIFMRQPIGYSDGTPRVCHLLRNLYGLKQAGNVDYCAYIKRLDDDVSILIVYVDDADAFASWENRS